MRNIANLLSLSRIAAVIPILVLAAFGMWQLVFIIYCLAWATDLFDGMIARTDKRWYPLQKDDFDFDGVGDSVLAFGSTIVPMVYLTAHYSFGWLAINVWILTIVSALLMVRHMEETTSRARRLIKVNMVIFHGLVQVGLTTLWFAYMACRHYGYGWWGVAAMATILLGVGICQAPKVGLWMSGALR